MSAVTHGRKAVIAAVLVLLAYSLVLNLPYFNVMEFKTEEGRRVNVALHMVESGQWMVPKHEGETYFKKPPGYNWLLAGMFALTGAVSEATARLTSVIAAFLCALSLSLFWRKAAGMAGIGFILPGLVFLTFPDVMDKAVRAEIDMTFTLFVSLSMIFWFYYYEIKDNPPAAWGTALFFVGIGVLTKGVQAPAFFYSGVVPYLIYRKDIKGLFSLSHIAGLLIALALFLLWLVPLLGEVDLKRLEEAWIGEVVLRRRPLKGSGIGGFLKHFVEFPFLYIKAYVTWIAFIVLWRHKPARGGQPEIMRLAWYCLFFLMVSIPLYWLLPGARLRYMLPVSGALALLVTIPINAVLKGKMEEPAFFGRCVRALGVIVMALAISAPLWGRKYELFERPASMILMAVVFLSALLLASGKGSFQNRLGRFLVLILAAKLFWASFYFPHKAEKESHYRMAAEKINAMVPPGASLYNYDVENPNIVFYLKRPVRRARTLEENIEDGSVMMLVKGRGNGLDRERYAYMGEVKVKSVFVELYEHRPHSSP
jgi:4-amino-4-deoxy-L-arabinose transferase-like glycosyltransferase